MAVAPTQLASATFLLLLLLSASDPILLRHSPSRGAFLLPLHRSGPETRPSSADTRRSLQRSDNVSRPNARMRLFDDLLLNGYYTTRLWIGTPPQTFALIVDTGSSVTYVPCSICTHCGHHQDPRFDPEQSNTYEPVKCNIDCTCDDQQQCVYERQYAEMSSSSGVLGEDMLSFGNQSDLPPQRAIFGCETMETGDLYNQRADGIMGLGSGELSIVDQLVDKGVISDSFSMCYGGMGLGGGAMVLGAISPPEDMVFAKSDPVRSPYYNVDLKEIHVAGKKLDLNPMVFDEKHGTVMDSGTTYAYLPEPAFVAFKASIMKELQSFEQVSGPDPNYNDICFSGAESNVADLSKSFPMVDMVFGDGKKLSLTPENYLFRHSKVHGAYCLGIFQNGRDPTTLLGGIVVRNTLVMYDRENKKIGFWKTNCSELWERLHKPDSSLPMSPPLSVNNVNEEVPPALAPNEEPDYALPENYQVGQITFVMSFNVSYSNLKPQITELTRYVALELDVNISQVHVINFTSNGNHSLVELAIVPAASSDSISHTIAVSIMAKLAEHSMQLPDDFSEYELVRWKAIPKAKRKWWDRWYLIVIQAIFVLVVTGLSAYGAWFIWKRRQQVLSRYTPVDSKAPEQELQPL